MNNKFNAHCLGLIGVLLAFNSHADDQDLPSLDMLEFLAEAEPDQNEWIDPLLVEEFTDNNLAQTQTEESRHD